MQRFTRFEDMESWKKGKELTRIVYELANKGAFKDDFRLKDQMRSASASIMLNIAEGFNRGGDSEFRQFLSQAKGSAGEVRSQAHVAQIAGYISEEEFTQISGLSLDCERLITGLMRFLNQSPYRGSKFKTKKEAP